VAPIIAGFIDQINRASNNLFARDTFASKSNYQLQKQPKCSKAKVALEERRGNNAGSNSLTHSSILRPDIPYPHRGMSIFDRLASKTGVSKNELRI
jgi:hypothetical protein